MKNEFHVAAKNNLEILVAKRDKKKEKRPKLYLRHVRRCEPEQTEKHVKRAREEKCCTNLFITPRNSNFFLQSM